MSSPILGSLGLIALIIAVSAVIMMVTSSVSHWPLVGLGILVGFLSIRAMSR
jgi:hypothetical protein